MNIGDKVKLKDGGIRIGTIVDLKNDVAKVEFPEQGRLPARTDSFYLDELTEVSKAQLVSQELKEALYHVYNPQEEEEENLTSANRQPYDSKDLRQIFMGTLFTMGKDLQGALLEAIDKMPDSWIIEFLEVINNDKVDVIKE